MKLSLLLPLLWVLCCPSIIVKADFLSLVLPTAPTNFNCSVSSPPASGCLYVSTQTAYCFGESNPSGSLQIPTLARYDNGELTWCKGSGNQPYVTSANSTIYGAGYDTNTGTLWAVASTGKQVNLFHSWTNYSASGFQDSYGNKGDAIVSVIAKVNTNIGFPFPATFLRAISVNGSTNSLQVTGLGLSQNGNLIVYADSADLPPGPSYVGSPIPSNCVSYSYPLKYTVEFNSDLSNIEYFCIDPAKLVLVNGFPCWNNSCPATKQQAVVVSQESPVIASEVLANGDSTYSSKNDSGNPLTYKLVSLIERDPSGNAVKTFAAFSGLQYTLESNGNATFQGLSAQQVSLTATFPVSSSTVSIAVDYYIFLEEGSVTWGSETFNVGSDTLKNTVTLSDWPFASTSNTLELKIQGVTTDGDVAWDDASKVGTFSSGVRMVFATSAKYDGTASNAAVGVTGSTSGLTLSVLISFNSFTTSVSYDPQLALHDSSTGSSSAASRFESFWC